MATAVLPPQHMPAPVPIFHAQEQPAPPHPEARPAPARPSWGVTYLHQPHAIPPRVFEGPQDVPAPPDLPLTPSLPDGTLDGRPLANGPAQPLPRPGPRAPVLRTSDMMSALLIHRVQPEYPEIARTMRLSGTVQLRAIIGTDGTVQNIEVVSGHPILANAAVAAVRRWRYQPTRLGGKPVEVETMIIVQFQMQQP